ncbi:YdeI/OmpD-associated family protein [Spirosoma fluviale]|uniref:Bacteriocin-protection, YdeI or OmpD-Associated n=1 Tax=Spirosoma fluviale TaxID=1597977 RepID=A0A286FI34_9BACT|nr:YdeI/OmpD-associated family protein [Spirosoma fluviale]SOD82746.1 Bacteriocin-protection, YdeI or OmpD-Associated [Spirosoma fluviale]
MIDFDAKNDINPEAPLVNKAYVLEKFPVRGGWTYAVIPEILPNPHAHFGWVRVRGTIDGFAISRYHLMPMGNGNLFLPVRAEIRKKIGKQAGDSVQVILYGDDLPTELPEELRLCLQDEPAAYKAFLTYPETEQSTLIDWIYSARTEETKVERIAQVIDKLVRIGK